MATVRLRIPELRARRRLSQRQVAAYAGMRADTISALERGKTAGIQFETIARLCEVLRCQPGDLFEFQPETHPVPVLGGVDEDGLIRTRLQDRAARVDGPSFIAEITRLAGEQTARRR